VNCPAGVGAAVSQIGMPAAGFRIPIGIPTPDPTITASLTVFLNARCTLLSSQDSMLKPLSSSRSLVAHAT